MLMISHIESEWYLQDIDKTLTKYLPNIYRTLSKHRHVDSLALKKIRDMIKLNEKEKLNLTEGNCAMNTDRIKKTIFVGTIGLMVLIIVLFFVYSREAKKKEAFDSCISTAKQICLDNNITVNDISIKYSKQYKEYNVYTLYVDGRSSKASMLDLYNLVRRIDNLIVDYEDTLLLSNIIVNGNKYELDVLNDKILTCDDKEVYTFVSEEDKKMKDVLKSKYPYEGLLEKYIGDTILGEPDKKEYSRDYSKKQERARWITYTWYDSKDVKKCEVRVSAWDAKNKKRVEPYVKYVDFWGDLLDLNPSYN